MTLIDLDSRQLSVRRPHLRCQSHGLFEGDLGFREPSQMIESHSEIGKSLRIGRALARPRHRRGDGVARPSGRLECSDKVPAPLRQVGPDPYRLLE